MAMNAETNHPGTATGPSTEIDTSVAHPARATSAYGGIARKN
jgi:hypothetical protein